MKRSRVSSCNRFIIYAELILPAELLFQNVKDDWRWVICTNQSGYYITSCSLQSSSSSFPNAVKFWFAEMLVPIVSCWAVHCVAEDTLLHLLASQLSLLNLNFPLKEQKWTWVSISDSSFLTYEVSELINKYINTLLPSVLLLLISTNFWGRRQPTTPLCLTSILHKKAGREKSLAKLRAMYT